MEKLARRRNAGSWSTTTAKSFLTSASCSGRPITPSTMSYPLRIEDAGVVAVGNDGGGLAASRHAPGNPTTGTPTTTTTAGGAEPEAPTAPKTPQEDAARFLLKA